MFNRIIPTTLLVSMLLLGCHKMTPEQFDNDKQLFEQANKLFNQSSYTESIPYFESLKNRFPASPYAADAELKIADAQFEKGDYEEAAVSYENFKVLHPSHPKIPYSTFRTGLSYYKDSPSAIDRDQTNVEKCIRIFSEVLDKWPASEEAKKAALLVQKSRRLLLRRELYIANFYMRAKKYDAALARLNNVRGQLESQDLADEGSYKTALAKFKLKKFEEAKEALSPVLKSPKSSYYKCSQKLATKIEGQLNAAAIKKF